MDALSRQPQAEAAAALADGQGGLIMRREVRSPERQGA
jgi:hypothetical protein